MLNNKKIQDTLSKIVELQGDKSYKTIDEMCDWFSKKDKDWLWKDKLEEETFYISEDPDDYIIDTRQLSKKHLFDFEIKYRPILVQHPVCKVNDDTKLTLKLLDTIISGGLLHTFFNKEGNVSVFDFLDSYKDIIAWFDFLYNNETLARKEIYKITEKYSEFFNNECWQRLTYYCYDYRDGRKYRSNYIRKYREKLDWKYLSGSDIDLDPYFILEMRNYIDFNMYFSNLNKHSQLRNQMKLYTLNNLGEVLTYRKEE